MENEKALADYLDDIKLAKIVNARIDKEWDKAVEVNINDCLSNN